MTPNPTLSGAPDLLRRRVQVVAYDPAWPRLFERLRDGIQAAIGDTAVAIEHVGSTAVPGLAAKPIIDIDVVVPSRTEMPATIERLAGIGYLHVGDLGIENREAFEPPLGLPPHHLYACVRGCVALENHLKVRDYLRTHRQAAQAYGKLKLWLAGQYPDEPFRYSMGKTDFLLTILSEAGCRAEDLHAVRRVNVEK